ncbi:MAG: hypothetical protein P8Z35_16555 [Ignavibacteriaceae bacterium]
MIYNKLKFIFFVAYLLSIEVYGQWEIDPLINFKNESPKTGVGIYAGRNLPFQWPLLGFKVRGGIDYFYEKSDGNAVEKYSSIDFNISIISTFFYRTVQPYLGFGLGIERLSIYFHPSATNKNQISKYIFLFSGTAGAKLQITNNIYSFVELQVLKYFYNFNNILPDENISALQLKGVFGICIEINLLKP